MWGAPALLNRPDTLNPKTHCAGRLEPVKRWFLAWEGAVLGGVFFGGLVALVVQVRAGAKLGDLRTEP